MKIVKILLIILFIVVAAMYTMNDLAGQFSSADEPPVLSCDSEILEVSVNDGDEALLAGVTAADEQDGDLTDRILVTGMSKLISDNTAKVTYAVFDSDDNMATCTRQIRYTDYRLPRFSLEEPLLYSYNQQISLLDRLHAIDVIDGDITDSIRVSDYTEGTSDSDIYTVDLQVTNSMGDTAWLTLPVIITDDAGSVPVVTLDTYLLYLEQGADFDAAAHILSAEYNGLAVSTDSVRISGEVDTAAPGTYMVQYSCTSGSRTGTAILTVVVE